MMNAQDWNGTGLPGVRDSQQSAVQRILVRPPSLLDGVPFTFNAAGPSYSTYCSAPIANYVGSRLSPGMCFIFDILYQNHLMPIIQIVIDGATIMALFTYIRKQWLKYM
jgi:hypothetical protein